MILEKILLLIVFLFVLLCLFGCKTHTKEGVDCRNYTNFCEQKEGVFSVFQDMPDGKLKHVVDCNCKDGTVAK